VLAADREGRHGNRMLAAARDTRPASATAGRVAASATVGERGPAAPAPRVPASCSCRTGARRRTALPRATGPALTATSRPARAFRRLAVELESVEPEQIGTADCEQREGERNSRAYSHRTTTNCCSISASRHSPRQDSGYSTAQVLKLRVLTGRGRNLSERVRVLPSDALIYTAMPRFGLRLSLGAGVYF
jgi:hypothetical protein